MKPNIINENKEEQSLLKLKFHKSKKQKDNENLVIRVNTRLFLKSSQQLSLKDKKEFFECVSEFFVASCTYVVQKFPLEDEFLNLSELTDITLRTDISFSSILNVVQRFPVLAQLDMSRLEEEFAQYQIEDLQAIPQTDLSIDSVWVVIGKIKDTSGNFKYQVLPKVMLATHFSGAPFKCIK